MPIPYDPTLASLIDPESFSGKLYLLMIDKLVIGAIIALAFVVYDRWKTAETRRLDREKVEQAQRLETQAKQVAIDFERAKLIKEFVPIITSHDASVVTRAYILRSAIQTGSLDAEAGVELARDLLADGLEDEHFKRVMATAMPEGLPAICRHATVLAQRWEATFGDTFQPTAIIDPVSGYENIAPEMAAAVREARLWRAIIVHALPRLASYPPLERTEDLATLLPGLFLLLNPGSQTEALDMSRNQSRGVALCGYIARIHFDSRDRDAADKLGEQLVSEATTPDGAKIDQVVFALFRKFGLPSGSIAVPVAKIATGPPLPQSSQLSAREAHYWLQWHAAEFLFFMKQHAVTTELNGAREAEPVILEYLGRFRSDVEHASSPQQVDRVISTYEGGKIVRVLIDAIGEPLSHSAKAELQRLMHVGEDKLRNFPFLREDIERALAPSREGGA